ncbi:hypothetical protein B0H11DRAFT_2240360 [Mycena galericulata]|nr:hypothetical protein B0H11DRAFT_2240360 [Mycena galericulata]
MAPSSVSHRQVPRSRPVKAVAVTCDNCKRDMEARAFQVAPLVPAIDRATVDDLENRLFNSNIAWSLDEDTNVPYCSGEHECSSAECSICAPYLLHLTSSIAGFSTDDDYLAYQSNHSEKDNQPRPPLIILDDETPVSGSTQNEAELPAAHPESGSNPLHQEAKNPDLTAHLELVMRLQSARGRMVMNNFIQSDNAAMSRLQGVVTVLETLKQSAKDKRDQMKARLIERRQSLQCSLDEVEQMQKAVEAIEDARRRRCPGTQPPLDATHQPPGLYHDKPIPLVVDEHSLPFTPAHPPASAAIPDSLRSLQGNALFSLSRHELAKLRTVLASMKAPAYDQPPEIFARWMQAQHETRIKGVPTCAPHWIVDLRDVRGRNAVMSRVPPGPKVAKRKEERHHHGVCLLAVLRVLAIPGAYKKILERLGIRVAGNVRLSCIFSAHQTEPPMDEYVVRSLAAHGLTVEVAEDSHQFCIKLLEAHVRDNTALFPPGAAKNLLELAHQELEISGQPPGLHPKSQDQLPRFNGLTQA